VPEQDPFFAGPSGPKTTEPEFYATPSNKVAKLTKAVTPQRRGDGVKAQGATGVFGELLAACLVGQGITQRWRRRLDDVRRRPARMDLPFATAR
jgi:hypothetical protein